MAISVQKNDVVPLIKEVLSSMEIPICLTGSTDNGDGTYTLTTCNTQYLRPLSIFSVGSDEYQVNSFVLNESITYTPIGGAPEITDCFDLRVPYLLVGTPRFAETELRQLRSDLNRHPFIWLMEVFASRFNVNPISPVSNTPTLTMFFLDASEDETWLNSDHRENVIEPIKSLVDVFIDSMLSSKKVYHELPSDFVSIDRVKYGKYEQNKGNTKLILGEKLSGVELRIDFSILAYDRCSSNTNCN